MRCYNAPISIVHQITSGKELEMTLDQLVLWIIVGGIAGLLADAFVRGIRIGLVGAVVVGVLGAILGGWLFAQLGISLGTGILGEIIVAFVGAVILLLLMRGLRRL
jgi:uncharacterized membrane protein YeaQ/YmgE (transglycosylase-associated protein family)